MDVVLASGNPGKLGELAPLLAELDLNLRPQAEFALPPVVESGTTFVENAIIKARHAARHAGLPAIADDSGIAVDALGGAPGVYSARYAGAGASDADNLQRLLAATATVADDARACHFICVLAFMQSADDPLPLLATGIWHGSLLRAPRGDHGFGYDPIFFVPEYGCAAAELPRAVKHSISHRAQALRALRAALGLTTGRP